MSAGAAGGGPRAALEALAGPPARPGTVALVGAGPGDPGLAGLRAARLVATADVVAHDRLAPAALLGLCRADAEVVDVGKQPDRHPVPQEDLHRLLVDRALAGLSVVRLKGGDPFVLGRGSEEAEACAAAQVPFEVVPGITSALAAPAYAGIPATHRGAAPGFAVVTGHEDPGKPDEQVDWAALARFPGTLLVLMGVGRLEGICRALVDGGRAGDEPAAAVQWGTTPAQRTVRATLADLPEAVVDAGLGAPAVVVVGPVAAQADRLAWFEPGPAAPGWVAERRPLHGRTVLVPRARAQAGELSARLRALGADPLEAPAIAIEPPADPDRLAGALRRARSGGVDWVVLTSPNGVAALAGALEAAGGGSALLARADLAGDELPQRLRAAGWDVEEVEAYRTVRPDRLPEPVRAALDAGRVDVVALASSSTVRNLVDLLGGPPPDGVRIASIGPVTSATCRELGLTVDVEAASSDLDGLVDAVVAAAGGPAG